mmetsp:Transcript_43852/g.145226  ORF Transcript_43852/g.145226 Transcript_43852/m.145226 type:complete len:218 (-) Transcript_43852:722-1375(-)
MSAWRKSASMCFDAISSPSPPLSLAERSVNPIASLNSAGEIVPDLSVSMFWKVVRSSASTFGGVAKAITSSATFLMSSARAKDSSEASTAAFLSSASPASTSFGAQVNQGCLSASEAEIRCFGSFWRSARMKSMPSEETWSHSAPEKGTGVSRIIRALTARSWWWKGRFPDSSMYVTTPIAQRSTDESYSTSWSAQSSGAMYDGVPICSRMPPSPPP